MLGLPREAPYQTSATRCFPQAWDKWRELWWLLMSWSHIGRGWRSPGLDLSCPCISAQHRGLAPGYSITGGEWSSDPHLKYISGVYWTLAVLPCLSCAGYRYCVARQGFGLQIPKSPTPLFGDSCCPMRSLISFPLPCRAYHQSPSPRQFPSMFLAELLRFCTEKRSSSHHCLCMMKGSVVFFLWSLKHISDLKSYCKTSNPPRDLIFKGTDLIPRRQW